MREGEDMENTDKMYENLIYSKMKDEVRKGIENALLAIIPGRLSEDEARLFAPGLLLLLKKATDAAYEEVKKKAEVEIKK
jgi:hypothetical protein